MQAGWISVWDAGYSHAIACSPLCSAGANRATIFPEIQDEYFPLNVTLNYVSLSYIRI